jgi:hypothetical protein
MRWPAGLVVLVLGCTASHPRPSIDEAEFLAEAAALDCARELRCGTYGGMPQGRCHPEASAPGEYGLGSCPSTFNPFAAVRCLDGMANDPCIGEAWQVTSRACSSVFASPPPPGSSCERWECDDGEVCSPAPECEEASCPWSCRPRFGLNVRCRQMTRGLGGLGALGGLPEVQQPECEDGLDCVPTEPAAMGVLVCTPRTAIGAACHSAPCSAGQACVDGLCARVDAVGDPCSGECGAGLMCTRSDAGDFTCQPRFGEGAACTNPCAGIPLCSGSVCDEGLICEGGVCAPVVGPGAACGESGACPHAFDCIDGVCVADPVEGEACTDVAGCARGVCREGTCVLLEAGEACDARPIELYSGLSECEGGCWSGTASCLPLIAEGEACELPLGAPTGYCERGTRCDLIALRCRAYAELCR